MRAEVRAEELTALINSRPGKLLKLFTAIGFAVTAVCVRLRSRSRSALGAYQAGQTDWRPRVG
ncbi:MULTISPECIES: hypothetical protein [Nonomuraea]|uniref:Uncharacterized protein n=1 Tax=Nonomuraea mangrovi TaxID=2316207 RepID=A0ABW4SNE8_9ACTN